MAKTSGGGVAAFFFFVLLTEICVSGFFLPNDFIRRNAELEWTWVNRSLGESTNREITALADRLYASTLLESHAEEALRLWVMPTERERRSKSLISPQKRERIWTYYAERLDAVFDTAYWFFRRLALFLIWLPLWIPAFVIAIRTGLLSREIKKSDFAHTSPVVQHHAFQALGLGVFGLTASFLFPLAVPPVVIPVFCGCVMVLLGLACGNIQKRI